MRPMPHKRAGDVVRVGAVEDGTVAQGGPFDPAANTVVAVEHCEQNSFQLGLLEAAGGIGGKGHLGFSLKRGFCFPQSELPPPLQL